MESAESLGVFSHYQVCSMNQCASGILLQACLEYICVEISSSPSSYLSSSLVPGLARKMRLRNQQLIV